MKDHVKSLISLKKLYIDLLREVGIDWLEPSEQSVLLASRDLTDPFGAFEPHKLLDHEFCSHLSKPTIYRNLATLEGYGLIKRPAGRRRGIMLITRSPEKVDP